MRLRARHLPVLSRGARGPLSARVAYGFVLLEVLVSLMILGVSLAAIMRSFTQSLKGVKLMEVQTQAQFFAMQLLHELEVNPPDEGDSEGGFGDDYKEYSFKLKVTYERPKYPRMDGTRDIERYFPLRLISLTINYNDGKRPPFTALTLESAVTGFEKLSGATKMNYGYY